MTLPKAVRLDKQRLAAERAAESAAAPRLFDLPELSPQPDPQTKRRQKRRAAG
jgi:hypothetical protein